MKIDGRCHRGCITYEAEIDPEKVLICHCCGLRAGRDAPRRRDHLPRYCRQARRSCYVIVRFRDPKQNGVRVFSGTGEDWRQHRSVVIPTPTAARVAPSLPGRRRQALKDHRIRLVQY